MAEVPLEVRVTVDSAAVRKALRGMQKDVSRSEKDQRKELDKTDRARERSMGRRKRGLKELDRELKNSAKKNARELEQSFETGTKRGLMRVRKVMGAARKSAGFAGLFAFGALNKARDQSRQFTQIPSTEQAFSASVEYRRRFQKFGSAAELTEGGRDKMLRRFRDQSQKTGMQENEFLSGAEVVQEAIGSKGLEGYLQNLDELSDISQGLGVPMGDLAGIVVELDRQFGIAAEDIPEALGFLTKAALNGSIEVGNFSQEFRNNAGLFAVTVGKGTEGFKKLVAAGETVGTVHGPAEAATALLATTESLVKPATQKKLRKYGLPQSTDPLEVAAALRTRQDRLSGQKNAGMKRQAELFDIFGTKREVRGMRALVAQQGLTEELMQIPGQVGLDVGRKAGRDFRGSEIGKHDAEIATRLRDVNEDFVEISRKFREESQMMEKLIGENTVAVKNLERVWEGMKYLFGGLGIRHVLKKMGPGAAAATTAAEGTVATEVAVGTGAAGTGLGSLVGPGLGAGVLAGLAAYLGSEGFFKEHVFKQSTAEARKEGREPISNIGQLFLDPKKLADDMNKASGSLRRSAAALEVSTANVGKNEGD